MIDAEVMKGFGEFAGGIAIIGVPLLIKWLKQRADKVNFAKKKMDISQMISDRLAEMRSEHSIDRLSIFEFSNGDKSCSGFPFLFVTMTYEKCERNIASIRHLFNKVPASWYVDINGHFTTSDGNYGYFFDDGRCRIGSKDEFTNEEAAKILIGLGIKSMWAFRLGSNISYGMLNIAFIDEHRMFSHDEVLEIMGNCKYVENLFNQRPQ